MSSVDKLAKGMEELSVIFSSRMADFEKNMPQPGAKDATTVKSLAADYAAFKSFIWKAFSLLKSQIELLALESDRLDMYSRRKVLLVHGLKEDSDEDVLQKTLALEPLSLHQMKLTTGSDVIESCHRLGPRKDGSRPVLVRFTDMKHRAAVWNAKTALKGSKITISEFLTKVRQRVFTDARNHFGIKKCWSSDGAIVVLLDDKTRKKIFSMAELMDLISKYPSSESDSKHNK